MMGFVRTNSDHHAIVIADTNEGLFVIEPQTWTMIALAKYPNRNLLEEVRAGLGSSATSSFPSLRRRGRWRWPHRG